MTDRAFKLQFCQTVLSDVLMDPKTTVSDRREATASALRHLRWRDRFTLLTQPEWAARPNLLRRWLLTRR